LTQKRHLFVLYLTYQDDILGNGGVLAQNS